MATNKKEAPAPGEVKLPTWTCLRCEHTWVPRRPDHPRICPKCKSPYWDRPRRK